MKNIKNKMALSASIMALADFLAMAILVYVGYTTMNLVAWVFLLLLGLIFAYDASRAIKFVMALLKH